ncbi:acetate/propionate family kinase [Acetobacter cerevisiae]|uniref:acetate/propionate family kinase n=1 Tax=Acetobacter cerevisiae TaxID=178900 RepID=UPI00209DF9F5|nr:acetate/propionate family kinase [Acetobacter cerevisiae]MCP1270355.1 acetate/propionate family kinase [Acetobacter cerevisiae]MCP1278308.1 acetate/propionate family kinase [Acetobacter cerevisiae]
MQGVIIVFNSGSSSLKFTVYDKADSQQATVLLNGEIEQNPTGARFHAKNHDGAVLAQEDWPETGLAIFDHLFHWLEQFAQKGRVVAAGHRIVHGGADFLEPVKITPEILNKLDQLTPFDPLHQQATLAPAKAIAQRRPDLLQVACFDTTFHSTIPKVARLLPLPRRYEERGVVRYGFHGISYSYIAQRLAKIDPELATGRTIIAHLGSGASLCALKDGKSLETTMGFSALDGLMMGTRCGAIDPGVLLYMVQEEKADWRTLVQTLYHESGLLGVSGISPDMRVLREMLAKDASSAQSVQIAEALSLFVYRIRQEIGALTAVMGGLDGLVFTAGIGEHDAALRHEVSQAFSWAGVTLDEAANQRHDAIISTPDSQVRVRVEPTDEEREIYMSVLKFL